MLKRRITALSTALAAAALCCPAAALAADPVIAAAGDIACDPANSEYNGGLGTATSCRQRYTSDLLVGGGLAAVLPLGDVQYEDATLLKFQTVFDPTWGRVSSISRPVPGNHEYPDPGGYFDYFNGVGKRNGPAGDRGKGYYSFDVGRWHLIALNSNCLPMTGGASDGCARGSPQERWLKSDLAAHPNSCLLAYWHHPLFNSGRGVINATNMTAIWRTLYNAHADVVLNGHAHSYERFALQSPSGAADATGIREFVVGTGGRNHKSFNPAPEPNSKVREKDTFGVLRLTLRSSGYDWRFVPEAGASFTDSGTQACHKPVTSSSIPATQKIGSGSVRGYVTLGGDRSTVEGAVLADSKTRRAVAAKSSVIAKSIKRRVKAGRFKVVVSFNSRVRQRLKQLTKIKLTLRITVTPARGRPVAISRVVTLKR